MKKTFCYLIALSLSALIFTACTEPATHTPEPSAPVAPADTPPAQPDTSAEETDPLATEIMIIGSSSLAPVITSIADDFRNEHVTWDSINPDFPSAPVAIHVTSGGSGQGIRSAIDGTTDFAMSTRELNDTERDEIPGHNRFLVGVDALTIAVNTENPLASLTDDLTVEQIVRIFSGEYATWQDFDPSLPDDEIVVIVRDAGGSAVEVFQDTIMGDEEVRIDAIQAPSMGALTERILENNNAIGYPTVGMANQNADNLVIFSIDGVAPSTENILDGSYFISRPMLLIAPGELDAVQQSFIDVVLGPKGQERFYEMGFVPVN